MFVITANSHQILESEVLGGILYTDDKKSNAGLRIHSLTVVVEAVLYTARTKDTFESTDIVTTRAGEDKVFALP